MKRIALAAAALFVASCTTAPYLPAQPPYAHSEPFPYPAPSAPGTYPGRPYQPIPPECPISASSQWAAWINAMPGPNARPTLIITGNVETPTGGYYVALDPDLQIAESYPAEAFARLNVAPPRGGATEAVVNHQVRWQWTVTQPIGRVVVRCGDKILAGIAPVQTAH